MVADEGSRGAAARIKYADDERANAFSSSGTFRSGAGTAFCAHTRTRTICAAQIDSRAGMKSAWLPASARIQSTCNRNPFIDLAVGPA